MFTSFDLLSWGVAGAFAVGLVSASLAFLAGRFLIAPRVSGGINPARPAESRKEANQLRYVAPDPFIEGPSRERRCYFRRGGNPTQVAVGHPEEPSELARGVVVDRSTGGVCLEMHTPLAVGAVVSIRPSVGTTLGTWVVAEVRNCKRDREAWRVGFKFVRTPPLSVLWMFG
jgi:PilZ domain-containing protein